MRLDHVREGYTRGNIDCFYKHSFLPESVFGTCYVSEAAFLALLIENVHSMAYCGT